MSGKNTGKRSKRVRETPPTRGRADWDRLRRMSEEEIERTSPPELANLPEDFWKDARVVYPDPKVPISVRIDRDVLEWFRRQGPKYQSRMNAVLRAYMKAHVKR